MNSGAVKEPPIDTSLAYYMEKRALEVALSKAGTDDLREKVRRLMVLREDLLARRAAHAEYMQRKRHERGEIYSGSKVKALNSMGPSKGELDRNVQALYLGSSDAEGVLKAHARVEFAYGLVSKRSLLAYVPDDVRDAARHMLELEEDFARDWVASCSDPAFSAELANLQREAALSMRTASSAIYLESFPPCAQAVEVDSRTLGRSWDKLDALAKSLGVQPLTVFVGVDGQRRNDSAPASEVLATVQPLIEALGKGKQKIPAKTATRDALMQLSRALTWLQSRDGRVYFSVDI